MYCEHQRSDPPTSSVRVRLFFALLVAGFCFRASADDFQGSTHLLPFDEDTIGYSKTLADNLVSRLQARINKGEVKLRHDSAYGYLESLLDELRVPKSSQMLVFSRTSFQRDRISPGTPRALYFNDDVYIGFIPGSPMMEVSVADPKLGAVFYSFDQTQRDTPRFVRTDQCLECHASAKSLGVPGHLVRSFETDENGSVDLASGASQVNHRTPLAERWGGWYVTGTHGKQTHRGNLIGKAAFEQQEKQPNYLGNLTDLKRFFDVSRYPAPDSDLVALMVLAHQTHMHNFITRLNYESTIALNQYGHVNYLNSAIEAFLKYLLFTEETPLTEPIKGTSAFAESFSNPGPRDKLGRSLRDLDLNTRLFKYPCSYLIYSDAFDHLPVKLKERVYQRLREILCQKDSGTAFQDISAQTRRSILEILLDTKHDLRACWKAEAAANEKRD